MPRFTRSRPAPSPPQEKIRTPGGALRVIRVARPLNSRITLRAPPDRKSTRLNSSHGSISYAVFCLKKKKKKKKNIRRCERTKQNKQYEQNISCDTELGGIDRIWKQYVKVHQNTVLMVERM